MTQTASRPRLEPLEPPYSESVATALERWMPPGSPVEPLRLFRTLMRHEQLASRMRPLGAGILGPSATVPMSLREVMIHRTCALNGAEYEWGVHAVSFGAAAGFSDDQLRSTVHGSWQDDCWSADAALVFRLADELHSTSEISQEVWSALNQAFSTEQILELVVTAGWYRIISYLCNGLGIDAEAWAATFPGA
jgi:4-carboxymuconolactone decarboxylase